MDFSGHYPIPAPPDAVWAALNDPEVLKACVPGCQALTKTGADHFDATATLKIGPVKATFKAGITLTDTDPPRRCILKGEGQGGVAGFARGEAEVLLAPDGDGTMLTYTAKATVGGKLAQIGQRLIDGAARQIADDFFTRFVARVAPATAMEASEAERIVAAPDEAIEGAPAMPLDSALPVATGRREGLAPEVWVIGLIGVIVILLLLFGVTL